MAAADATTPRTSPTAPDAVAAEQARTESIRRRAYALYEARTDGTGDALADWLAAEAQVERDSVEACDGAAVGAP